jgi:hypothetical protein
MLGKTCSNCLDFWKLWHYFSANNLNAAIAA